MTLETHARRHAPRYIIALLAIFLVAFVLITKGNSTAAPLHLMHEDEDINSQPRGKELLLVQAVFRHGARTPLANIYFPETRWEHCGPNEGVKLTLHDENGGKSAPPPPILDLNAPLLPGGCRQGELTKNGYVMAKDLGTWLRSRYTQEMPFLSQDFKAEEVSLRTTCIARTVATLQGVLTGLWPDAARADAPPIPVNASQEAHEFEYGKNQTCSALGPWLALLQAKVAARDAEDAHAVAYAAEVAARLHLTTASLSWVRLHDVLAAMQAEGLPLPDGADDDLARDVADEAIAHEGAVVAPIPEQKFLPLNKCQQVVRMSIGPLLQRLVANMQLAGRVVQAALVSNGEGAGGGGSRGLLSTAAQTVAAAKGGGALAAGQQQARGLDDVDELQQQQQQLGRVGGLRGSPGGLRQLGTRSSSSSSSSSLQAARQLGQEEGAGAAAAGRAMPKLFMFSGHDSTITPLMTALGEPLRTWPPFSSNVVLELWGSKGRDSASAGDDDLEVRVLRDRQPLHMAHAGGRKGGWIRLTDFIAQLEPFSATAEQHRAECSA